MASIQQFLREYVKAIRDGNAAVFAGAGLSRPSGFVIWKDLLRPLAEDINLNIDDEHDLTAVAQYVRNSSGNRAVINSTILEAYSKDVSTNENVSILTRLPIHTYWTTNYDHLIEQGLYDANRNADVKIETKQLSITKRDRDAVVYKMHGDVDHPADAVITKDDYAKYDITHPFIRSVLQGDLISKTFLFVGFSFDDPNLDKILGQIRCLLNENIRNHYCFMRRIQSADAENEEQLGYLKARQDLREEDLKRYGIQIVFVDDYSEITNILRRVEEAVLANNIFISGSAEFFSDAWSRFKVDELAYKLAQQLVKEEFRITSGFGLGIGSSVINGALDEINNSKFRHISEHLCLRPFPQGISDAVERKSKWTQYRESILDENGIVIFIAGNKKDADGNEIVADGCIQEYEIAKKKGCLLIPIGTTGSAAAKIFDEIKNEREKYPYLDEYFDILMSGENVNEIVSAVLAIIKKQRIL